VLNKWVGRGLSFVVLVMAGVTLLEVVSRFAFDNPTMWAHEATGQMFGFYTIMGGGYLVLNNWHIRMDVLWGRLSREKQVIVDLCTFGFVFLYIATLLWFSGKLAWGSTLILERTFTGWSPYIFPLKIAMVLGVFLLLLQLLSKFIRGLHSVITGVKYV